MAAASAIAQRAFADARVRTISFALLFFVAALTQATAYQEGYPTLAERGQFARSIGANDAAGCSRHASRAAQHGGYVSWQVGGTTAVLAALFGLLGAVEAMRAEEDAGRADLLLSGIVSRRGTLPRPARCNRRRRSAVLWLALFVSFIMAGFPRAAPPGALDRLGRPGVRRRPGALTSQLAPTKRLATGLATAMLVIAFALRAVPALSSAELGWLRWTTPLGWVEELRPFADSQPLVLLLPAAAAALLLAAAGALYVSPRHRPRPAPGTRALTRTAGLLGSPAAHALRSSAARSLVAWLVGVGAFALLMGVLSGAVTPDVLCPRTCSASSTSSGPGRW